MNTFIENIKEVDKLISKEKGNFNLFGIFIREGLNGKWDILASADWISYNNEGEALKYFIQKLKKKLSEDDIMKIASIILLEPKEPFVKSINNSINTLHSAIKINGDYFNDLFIQNAFIFTSQKQQTSKKK